MLEQIDLQMFSLKLNIYQIYSNKRPYLNKRLLPYLKIKPRIMYTMWLLINYCNKLLSQGVF